MNVALFFDSNHKSIDSLYGHYFEDLILRTRILQNSGEKVVLRGGDLIVHHPGVELYGLLQDLFGGPCDENGRFDHSHMRADLAYRTAMDSVVFAIVIHGVSYRTLDRLEDKLLASMAYLGWNDIDLDFEPHAALLCEYLTSRYLIEGQSVKVPLGSVESDEHPLPEHLVETLKVWGFQDIGVAERELLALLQDNATN